jgi:hypothetical protein
MRRIDLINGVKNISYVISEGNLLNIFAEKTSLNQILASYKSFNNLQSSFSNIEFEILEILGLDALREESFWVSIIGGERAAGMPTVRALRNAIDLLPRIVDLLKQHNVVYDESDSILKVDAPSDNLGVLTIILPEKEHENSSPLRLVKALESINIFYSIFETLGEASDIKLGVAAIDSGSDKSFDFTGAAKCMQEIKELLISMWDRIVYYRERQASERIDLVIKSLPILERISELQKLESIGPEQAEILKRNVFHAVNNFIEVGAVIPELEQYSYHNPRVLLAPESKLLNQAAQSTDSEETPHKKPIKPMSALANLSEDDIRTLKAMLKADENNEE